MKKIIIDPTDLTSIEVKENMKIGPNLFEDPHGYGLFVIKEFDICQQLKRIIDDHKYPLVLAKIVEFRNKYPNEYAKEDLDDLKDFFKVVKKIHKLMKQKFRTELILTMIECSTIGLGIKTDSEFCHKYNRLMDDDELRKDFWGTKLFESILVARALLEDIYDGVDVNNLDSDNLQKSHLVNYCIAEEDDEVTKKNIEKFISFCQS